MDLQQTICRFRAYQIGAPGSLFSLFDGSEFILIDANVTNIAESSIVLELGSCGKKKIDRLHLTSWDADHCSASNLTKILNHLRPNKIDLPGYEPDTDNGVESKKLIEAYKKILLMKNETIMINTYSPEFSSSLGSASEFGRTNVFYNPMKQYSKHNDNSTVMLFRYGHFTVASLGDVESPEIAKSLMQSPIFCNEIDIMLLAHHGADNGFTTQEFIHKCRPTVAICSADYSNKHDHPRQEIRDILYIEDVRLYTTKTGDVVVVSNTNDTQRYKVVNTITNSTEVSSEKIFYTKRALHFSPLARLLSGYQ